MFKLKKLGQIFSQILLLIAVASCSESAVTATKIILEPTDLHALPTAISPKSTITRSPTSTYTPLPPTISPTRTEEPSPTPYPPYPLKQVLIKFGLYQVSGGAIGDAFIGFNIPHMVLYSDGQFLQIGSKTPILEGKLTDQEMCILWLKLGWAGIDKVKSGNHHWGDPLYMLPTKVTESFDADEFHLLVNGNYAKEIGIYAPYYNYLVPSMENILKIIMSSKPSVMKPYQVDRLILYRWPDIFGPIEGQQAVQWPEGLKPIEDENSSLYLTGDEANRVFGYFQFAYNPINFIYKGKTITVEARPMLPDETFQSIPEFRGSEDPSKFPLPFNCPN